MDQTRTNRPLSDVTVIDFGQIFQGPYASLLLAKAGAFVIKIEPPRGEPGRRRADPGKSATLPFAMLNQNKHAVTLNLKEPRGRELLFRTPPGLKFQSRTPAWRVMLTPRPHGG